MIDIRRFTHFPVSWAGTPGLISLRPRFLFPFSLLLVTMTGSTVVGAGTGVGGLEVETGGGPETSIGGVFASSPGPGAGFLSCYSCSSIGESPGSSMSGGMIPNSGSGSVMGTGWVSDSNSGQGSTPGPGPGTAADTGSRSIGK